VRPGPAVDDGSRREKNFWRLLGLIGLELLIAGDAIFELRGFNCSRISLGSRAIFPTLLFMAFYYHSMRREKLTVRF